MTNKFSYDAVPYPSFTFPQTNPSRLAVMAAYHGMMPASPESCRVLELGCGDGANLLSFASIFTLSEFVGIDLSEVHVEDARKSASDLALLNVSFLQKDVTELNCKELGTFDYIIAHGLYSWVPNEVRRSILHAYRECLAPNGVGYISYNAYPGSYYRDISRDIMKFHTSEIAEPVEKVREGVKLLSLLAKFAEKESAYRSILEAEHAKMLTRRPENIYHDELGEVNRPFYFYEFARNLEDVGLQYLSECHPWDQRAEVSAEAEQAIADLTDDIVRKEQYRDFVSCRRFRSTLVCRKEVEVDRDPGTNVIKSSYIVSKIHSVSTSPDLRDGVAEKFIGARSQSIEVNHPLTKAALVYLQEIWARSASFEELISNAQRMLGHNGSGARPEDVERTAAFLLQMFEAGFIALDRFQAKFASSPGDFPESTLFGKWQVLRGSDNVTTLTGMNMELDNDLIKFLILLLDGNRNREMLFAEVLERAEVPEGMREDYEKALPGLIEQNLTRLAQSGMLVGPAG
jgi:methyltransferase-like protein/2-polyprenyl-3-methyl-5-hydroxy-6-metoxy-1,4-benzoquinol methylase